MAKQTINTGTTPNDGTGDTLRAGGEKINDNFDEIYKVHGWGYYQDSETSPATQVFNSTPSKIQIDSAGVNTNTEYLPLEIRGTGDLWDAVTNKITPIGVGDSYSARIDYKVISESGNPSDIITELDIGGAATPTIVIVDRHSSTGKATPYNISIGIPIFTLGTFTSNGGQIFVRTDTGSITVSARAIVLSRISSGVI